MEVVALAIALILNSAGEEIDLATLIGEIADRDVVFLGEEHDNSAGHALHLDILKALHAKRPDLVLSMEMFERDVQGVVDDYLRGRIDEECFLENSRPWNNYAKHYRPMVEYAKAHGLDVIAANVPRRLAGASARGEAVDGPWAARETTAPADRYRAAFLEAMGEHPGMDEDLLDNMYAAQCLKDDTMAESIADYLEGRPHRRPLVVHVCGKFHSDFGLGTVVRLLNRRPLTQSAVLSMASGDDPESVRAELDLERGHYTVVVPKEPKKKSSKGPSGSRTRTKL